MDQNSEKYLKLKKLADELEVRFNPSESERSIRGKISRAIIENGGESILAAEIILDKKVEDFSDADHTLCLGLHIYNSANTVNRFRLKKDTYYNMTWKEYNNLLFEQGFDRVLSYEFMDPSRFKNIEEYSIFARLDRGLLLVAQSYNNKSVLNSTSLYFEISFLVNNKLFPELENIIHSDVLRGTTNSGCFDENREYAARQVEVDVRQGLISYLSRLEPFRNQLNVPWKYFKNDFLWLLDFSETKQKNYDYVKINERKIAALPTDVQKMIGSIR
jgi:hypothetical protein